MWIIAVISWGSTGFSLYDSHETLDKLDHCMASCQRLALTSIFSHNPQGQFDRSKHLGLTRSQTKPQRQ